MRRSRLSRVFAALFAPWFALVVAEPVPMHDCPMHSLRPAAAHAEAAAPLATAATHGTPSMSHDGMEQSGATHSHGTHGHSASHQCCCLGACCAAAVASLGRVPNLEALLPDVRQTAPSAAAESFSPPAAEHVLPFANGPPATRA